MKNSGFRPLARGLLLNPPSIPSNALESRSTVSNLGPMRENQLEQEIAQLNRRVSDAGEGECPRRRCAHAYLKALMAYKQESLDLLRYRRIGRDTRWRHRPEVH